MHCTIMIPPKTYQKILTVLHSLQRIQPLELDDVIAVHDQFNVPEDEEINLQTLLDDIQVIQDKEQDLDPEQTKINEIEKRYDKIAKKAKAISPSLSSPEADMKILQTSDARAVQAAAEAKRLLDKLDKIQDQYEVMKS